MYQQRFINYDKCTILMQDINNRGNQVWGMRKLYYLCNNSIDLKCSKITVKKKMVAGARTALPTPPQNTSYLRQLAHQGKGIFGMEHLWSGGGKGIQGGDAAIRSWSPKNCEASSQSGNQTPLLILKIKTLEEPQNHVQI